MQSRIQPKNSVCTLPIFPYSTGVQNALLIHGMTSKEEHESAKYPTPSNSHWFPWLSKQLLMRSIFTTAIEMPTAYAPVYSQWQTTFEQYPITNQTILVGHSCGAAFLLRWLAEHPTVPTGKIVLVAPWLDPQNELANTDFCTIDLHAITAAHSANITIFHSLDDTRDIHTSVQRIRAALPTVQYTEFTNHGHFCLSDMYTVEFPELVQHLLS